MSFRLNPDGIAFVQAPNGYSMWKKNRNSNSGLAQKGVDLHRNYDFLWDRGKGTNTNPNKEIYRGKEAALEKETKNVLPMIYKYKNINCIFDVLSYSEKILYQCDDEESQTEDPDMKF